MSSQGIISLTDISVTTAEPSGNGSLAYSNVSGVFTFTPADAQVVVTMETVMLLLF